MLLGAPCHGNIGEAKGNVIYEEWSLKIIGRIQFFDETNYFLDEQVNFWTNKVNFWTKQVNYWTKQANS